jgi:hypothetical protein
VRFFDDPNTHSRDRTFRCVTEDPAHYAPFCEQIPNYVWGGGSGSPNPGTDFVCPIVSVSAEPQHCGTSSTYVKFNTNNPAQTTFSGVAGCGVPIVGGGAVFPQVYDCHAAGSADIDAYCTYSGGEASCAVNYTLDETTGVCKWDTSIPVGTACPEGYIYDEVNHCCTATPGSVADYPLCSAPSSMYELSPGHFYCISGIPPAPHDHVNWLLPPACDGENPYTGLPIILSPFYVALEEEKADIPVASMSGILTLMALGLVGWITRYGRKRS